MDNKELLYGFGHAHPLRMYPDGPEASHNFSWSDKRAAISIAPCECPKTISKAHVVSISFALGNTLSMTIASLSSNPSYLLLRREVRFGNETSHQFSIWLDKRKNYTKNKI